MNSVAWCWRPVVRPPGPKQPAYYSWSGKQVHKDTYSYSFAPSASSTHKLGLSPKQTVFMEKNKNIVLFLTWFFLYLGETLSFSHTWCQDISWSVPFTDLNRFIDSSLGSTPLSTLHVDDTSTRLALAGSLHKKGPDALDTCRDQSGVVGGLFPTRATPKGKKNETWL